MSETLSITSAVLAAADDQRPAIADAYHQAFGFTVDRSEAYIDQVGIENFRVLTVEGQLAAVMAVIDTAHWLGGRPVSAVNIAHVAVNPAWRGSGVAGRFLEQVCAEAAAKGTGLATLFASTRPVYRRAGFALAGLEMVYEADTSALPRARDTGFVRMKGDEAMASISALYKQHCEEDAGPLRRNPAHWANLLAGGPSIYVSTAADAAGYLVLDTSNSECLVVRDWVALNGKAATHLLSLIGTFSSVYPRVTWHGAPQDALVFAMPDKGWRLLHQEEWLARVLDPVRAMQERGYSADGTIGIDLMSPAGDTRLAIDVRGGHGTCNQRDTDLPTVRMALSDFGTLLTGHRSARFLQRAGILAGDATAIRLCETLFAGPAPWVGEHF
ncbi:putative acetyltransferase [Devosia sp. UYZn731]|uniref:GNAT family N-acetyltransferase n=1 Tax=Devosia sp. UYZn731 TaxID=3156345 RepID=UPI00339AD421